MSELEISQLRELVGYWHSWPHDAPIQKIVDGLSWSLAEIERLTRLVKIREAEIDWHVDEDKRLRAALEKIATDEPSAVCTVGCNEIARRALQEPEISRSNPCPS